MKGRHRRSSVVMGCAAAAIGGVAGAAEHVVDQVGITFVPDEITVAPGDTIRWVWSSGFHTVTTGVDCIFDGGFLNDPLFEGSPVVELVIPVDFADDIPYFCTPHCGVEMVGMIFVQPDLKCEADLDGSGEVDFGDVLQILAAWGPCQEECREDLDGSGAVDFGDILIVLATWGACT